MVYGKRLGNGRNIFWIGAGSALHHGHVPQHGAQAFRHQVAIPRRYQDATGFKHSLDGMLEASKLPEPLLELLRVFAVGLEDFLRKIPEPSPGQLSAS